MTTAHGLANWRHVLRTCAALLFGLIGCVALGFRPTPSPAEGGPAGVELKSQNFVVQTDLGIEEATSQVNDLEHLRAALRSSIAADAASRRSTPIQVVLFASDTERDEYLKPYGGLTWINSLGDAYIIASDERIPANRETFAHELTHQLIGELLPPLPRWLNEGLACYFESLRFREDANSDDANAQLIVLGEKGDIRNAAERMKVQALFRWGGVFREDPRTLPAYYYTSWLFVHDLMQAHEAQLADLQRRLRDQSFDAAFAAAFPGKTAEDFDSELRHFVSLNVLTLHAPTFLAPKITSTRVMPDAEVRALRAVVHDLRGQREGAERELAAALREDPNNLYARLVEIDFALPAERPRLARALVDVDPQSWRAQLALGQALQEGPSSAERTAALEAAVTLAPADAWQPRVLLASDRLSTGRAKDGLALAEAAEALAPSAVRPKEIAAAADFRLGKCADAVDRQLEIIALTPPERGPEVDARNQKTLLRYQNNCRVKPFDGPPPAP